MNITSVFCIATFSLASLFGAKAQTISESYHIEFERIDNRVEVWVGDSLVYNSGIIRRNPKDLGIKVYIDDLLLEKSNELTVKLINGLDGAKDGDDIHWEVKYVVFKGDELYEYLWEEADDGRVGVVIEETYILE
ncbi:MAG: hypothetical protein ABJG78_04545 [Cyclobacteriaceae bacterium]